MEWVKNYAPSLDQHVHNHEMIDAKIVKKLINPIAFKHIEQLQA